VGGDLSQRGIGDGDGIQVAVFGMIHVQSGCDISHPERIDCEPTMRVLSQ
jgi:hypothetical protein